jgi:cytoskeletal protein CcmA (bactofilin family)
VQVSLAGGDVPRSDSWATIMLTINSEVAIKGRLVVAGPVVLDLWFEGEIVCSRLEVRSNGYLQGSASAHEVIVHGQIVGPVHATSVTLKGGCFMEGDIHYTKLLMDHGATFTGRSSRFPAIQMPAELLELEAKQNVDQLALERATQESVASDPLWAAVNATKNRDTPKAPAPTLGVADPTEPTALFANAQPGERS